MTFRRLAVLAMIPAVLLGLAVAPAPADAAVVSWQTLQVDINKWTNYQRAKHNCAPLRTDSRLVRASRNHSAWMARTGSFGHTGAGGSSFVARERAAGYTAPLSENIAWGYRSGADVVNAWMRSPGHRANILNCRARAVGVGAVYSANGTPYYTQDFGSR